MSKRIVPKTDLYAYARQEGARVAAVGPDRLRVECDCGWAGPAWLRSEGLAGLLLDWELEAHMAEHGAR